MKICLNRFRNKDVHEMKTCIGLIFTLLWLLGLSFPKCLLLWDGLLQLRQKTRAPINHFLNKSGQFWNISNNVSVSPLNFSFLYVLIWAGRPQTGGMQTVSEENPTKYEGITRRYILPSPPLPPPHTHTHTKHTHARTKRPKPVIQVSLPETYILPGIFGLFINFCSLLMDH